MNSYSHLGLKFRRTVRDNICMMPFVKTINLGINLKEIVFSISLISLYVFQHQIIISCIKITHNIYDFKKSMY